MKGRVSPALVSKTIASSAIVLFAAYLVWRTATVSLTNPVALLFLFLEAFGAISFVLFVFSTWDIDTVVPASPRLTTERSIALFIATYNEDEHVLMPTVAAAVAIQPAHETWVLDDGNRPWVKEMAEAVGAIYVGREKNTHAKAGNINEALQVCDAEFIGFLDADHIPSEGFLTDTIGYFDDPGMALVQTPQEFYNTESFEHIGSYCEEELFYRVIQPGKNRWDGAFWCGTSAIIRTVALRSVGGVATDSVTEDLLTTIRLHSRGWKTVFHNDVLAKGLAPTTYNEYLVQRRRWASGAMQILRSSENPFVAPGLKTSQRISHFASLFGWFEGVRTLGYLALAVLVVLSNQNPVENSLIRFILFHVAVSVASQVTLARLGRGKHRFLPALLFDYLRIPATLTAMSQLFGNGRLSFQVTPKGRTSEATDRETTPPPLSLVVMMLVAMVGWGLFVLRGFDLLPGQTKLQAMISAIVLILNSLIIGAAIKRIRMGHFGDERRRARRFTRDISVLIDGERFSLSRASTSGGFVEGRPRIGRQQIGVMTREGIAEIDCWVASHDGDGSTVEFVPGQWSERARLARTLFLEALPVASIANENMMTEFELPAQNLTSPRGLRRRSEDEPLGPLTPRFPQPAHRPSDPSRASVSEISPQP